MSWEKISGSINSKGACISIRPKGLLHLSSNVLFQFEIIPGKVKFDVFTDVDNFLIGISLGEGERILNFYRTIHIKSALNMLGVSDIKRAIKVPFRKEKNMLVFSVKNI